MNNGDGRGDLLVLVADLDMEQTVKGLLARPESLQMAPVKFEVRRHLRRLRIQSHIDVHGGALTPRQRALV